MTSSIYLLNYILFLLIAQGYILLNEAFLISLCFIAFISTILYYLSNTIQDYFLIKDKELYDDEYLFYDKYKQSYNELFNLLTERKVLLYQVIIFNEYCNDITNKIIAKIENQIQNYFIDLIREFLNLMKEKELLNNSYFYHKFLPYSQYKINNDFYTIENTAELLGVM